jgi:hypothetical protein
MQDSKRLQGYEDDENGENKNYHHQKDLREVGHGE